jgi:hypothetical protein
MSFKISIKINQMWTMATRLGVGAAIVAVALAGCGTIDAHVMPPPAEYNPESAYLLTWLSPTANPGFAYRMQGTAGMAITRNEADGGSQVVWLWFPPHVLGGFTRDVLEDLPLDEAFLFPVEPGHYQISKINWEAGTSQRAQFDLKGRGLIFEISAGEVVYIGDWTIAKTSGEEIGMAIDQQFERRRNEVLKQHPSFETAPFREVF